MCTKPHCIMYIDSVRGVQGKANSGNGPIDCVQGCVFVRLCVVDNFPSRWSLYCHWDTCTDQWSMIIYISYIFHTQISEKYSATMYYAATGIRLHRSFMGYETRWAWACACVQNPPSQLGSWEPMADLRLHRPPSPISYPPPLLPGIDTPDVEIYKYSCAGM